MKAIKSSSIFMVTSSLLIIAISNSLFAQSTNTDTTNKSLSINGMFDMYFSKNLNNPESHINGYRNFDVTENQFDVNLAKVVFQKPAAPIGFRLDLAFGHAMDLVNSDASLGYEKSLRNIEQAYFTAVVPWGNGLTINAGKMVTHMGGEVIETASNINYSRSLLFAYAIPYFHLGVMASYPFSPQFSATFYVYNGWNNIVDNNKEKTFGAEIIWNPIPEITFIQNWIGGAEETGSTKKRHVFDSIINYQTCDALFFTLNADYGQEALYPSGYAIWKGIALTGKYQFNDKSTFGLRTEVYDDYSGFTTGSIQTLKEITLTYEYKFSSMLLTRIEYRRDWSTIPSFEDENGVMTKDNQNTFLIGSVISF